MRLPNAPDFELNSFLDGKYVSGSAPGPCVEAGDEENKALIENLPGQGICCGPGAKDHDDSYNGKLIAVGLMAFGAANFCALSAAIIGVTCDQLLSPPGANYHLRSAFIYACVSWVFMVARYAIQIYYPERVHLASFTVFALFYIFAQVYIFGMPTVQESAYSLCAQITNQLTQEFEYSVDDYPYPTTYNDIANLADIYAFIKGPVLAETIFTQSGTDQTSSRYVYKTSGGTRELSMAANTHWIVTGDIRIRQLRTKTEGSCSKASLYKQERQVDSTTKSTFWFQDCKDGCCEPMVYSSEHDEKIFKSTEFSDSTIPKSTPEGMLGDPFEYQDGSYYTLAGRKIVPSCVINSRYYSGMCYPGGGYIVAIPSEPKFSLAWAQSKIDELQARAWLDGQTAAVFVEFSVACPQAKTAVSVTVMIELPTTGEIRVAPFEFSVFGNHLSEDFWKNGRGHGFQEDNRTHALLSFLLFFFFQEWLELRKGGYRSYFTSKWNVMDLVSYIGLIVVVAIVLSSQYYWPNVYDETIESGSQDNFIPVATSAKYLDYSRRVFSLVSIFFSFRMLEYFSGINAFKKISRTFGVSMNNLAVFVVFFVLAMLGFAEAFMVCFSNKIYDYSSILHSFYSCTRALIGDVDAGALAEADPIFGRLFFMVMVFVMLFTLLTILIAIISEGYETAKEQIDSGGISMMDRVMLIDENIKAVLNHQGKVIERLVRLEMQMQQQQQIALLQQPAMPASIPSMDSSASAPAPLPATPLPKPRINSSPLSLQQTPVDTPLSRQSSVNIDAPSPVSQSPIPAFVSKQEEAPTANVAPKQAGTSEDHVAVLRKLFDQYDFDGSGTVNNQQEFYQLTVNALYKLGVGKNIDMANIDRQLTQAHNCEQDPLYFEQFVEFFQNAYMQ